MAHPVHDGEAAVVTEENISAVVQEVLDLVGQTEYPGQEHGRPTVLHSPRIDIRPGLHQALHGPPAGVVDAVVQRGLLDTVNTVFLKRNILELAGGRTVPSLTYSGPCVQQELDDGRATRAGRDMKRSLTTGLVLPVDLAPRIENTSPLTSQLPHGYYSPHGPLQETPDPGDVAILHGSVEWEPL